MSALTPMCLPLLCLSFWVLFYQHSVKNIEKKEIKSGQKRPLSTKSCRFLREPAEAVACFRAGGNREVFFTPGRSMSQTGTCQSLFFSLGSLSREFCMLSIAMIHALYDVSQNTPRLLEALPCTRYLISIVRGQWIQAKVLPPHISKLILAPLERACFEWTINWDLPRTRARNPSSSEFPLWVYLQEIPEPSLQKRLWLRCFDSQSLYH